MTEILDLKFDNRDRDDRISKAKQQDFDLIIVGGGITGAGIALDASLRGIKTLLLEKQDFASGTSSKSTKLIHGGLRYLKQLEIGLVRESGLERAVVHRNIPHLVHPETMILPIVENGEFNKITASLAIFVYDYLAKVPKKDRKKSFSKTQTLNLEPLLNPTLLKSSIAYSEYRTDDARLTMEITKAAVRNGAEAFNYLQVNDFLYENGKVKGVIAEDSYLQETHQFSAKNIVSAAGPWVDELRLKNNSLKGKRLHLTKGVHIVVSHGKFPINNSIYFDAFDGRMIFAIPRGKVTYIGTSDTNYSKDKNRVLCSSEDVDYLINCINKLFSKVNLNSEDVISSWAGLRPLIHEDGKSPSELSRKDEIFVSDSDLISIAGGKLTGFRKMSRKVVDLLIKKDPSLPNNACLTKTYKIHSNSFDNYEEFEKFQFELIDTYKKLNLSDYEARYLASTYGKNANYIIQKAMNYQELNWEKALLKSEILFTIEYESATRPDDFFNRRSGLLYFDIETVKTHFEFIIEEFKLAFSWSPEKTASIRSRCRQYITDVSIFQSEVLQEE